MPDRWENPFANYRPPALSEIFSETGRIAIVEFKAEQLAETIKQGLLEDDVIEEFLSGTEHSVDYDCTSLQSLGLFTHRDAALGFMLDGFSAGVAAAVQVRGIVVRGAIASRAVFKDEPPRMATVAGLFIEQ
jgi:hypothetical protein